MSAMPQRVTCYDTKKYAKIKFISTEEKIKNCVTLENYPQKYTSKSILCIEYVYKY